MGKYINYPKLNSFMIKSFIIDPLILEVLKWFLRFQKVKLIGK
jgi:hypothetical protein